MSTDSARPWWTTRGFALSLALLATVPLLWPAVPPLIDLPGHLGRYRIQLDLDSSPHLRQWFEFRWALVGNLGVDLLVELLGPVLGLERAVKLIVLAIPSATAAGFLWVAREAHGRLPPTAAFALPLAYGYPLQFGFVNFCLSMALAMLVFAAWLRSAGRRTPLRAALFAAAATVVWLAHAFGWAVLAILCFAAEARRALPPADGGASRAGALSRAVWRGGLRCLPLALPLLPMLAWRAGGSSGVGGWFDLYGKAKWGAALLRDRWLLIDVPSAAVIYLLIAAGLLWRSKLRFEPVLGTGALLLWITFLLLPSVIFGSAFADQRLLPYAAALSVLALRPGPSLDLARQRRLALIATGFVGIRLLANAASLAAYDASFSAELAALHHVPRGARVAAFVESPCGASWTHSRLTKLPSMAIARREAFTNDQFAAAGMQLLRVDHPAAGAFQQDPSSVVAHRPCPGRPTPTVADVMAELPMNAFDQLWLIGVPHDRWPTHPALRLVWRRGDSALFRITRGAPGSDPVQGAG